MEKKSKKETPGSIMAELIGKQLETGKVDEKLKKNFEDATRNFFESHGCNIEFKRES